MATTTQVPVEVYLRSIYEPDAEYVDGQIVERPVGVLDHADWQAAISAWFRSHANQWNVRVFPELRVQVNRDNYRVPDVTVLDRALPTEQIITHPPIAVFEILSPEDTIQKMKRKLQEYAQMGIPQIWLIDPEDSSFERYVEGRVQPASRFEQGAIQFEVAEIAKFLQA